MTTERSAAAKPRVGETQEGRRLASEGAGWRQWGPYLTDRQWGTVREDYSADGTPGIFPVEHARSRAYRWGEDGIAGFADDRSGSACALALWNGADPNLKERLFGLSNAKAITARTSRSSTIISTACRATPTCGCCINIRRRAFPTSELRGERRRGLIEREYRTDRHRGLRRQPIFRRRDGIRQGRARGHSDAGHGDQPRARAGAAPLLPQILFRNRWSWSPLAATGAAPRGGAAGGTIRSGTTMEALCGQRRRNRLFCENDTNTQAVWARTPSGSPRTAINDYVVHGD